MMDDDDERKEPFLHQMNASVGKLSFVPQKPVLKQLYKAGQGFYNHGLFLFTICDIICENPAYGGANDVFLDQPFPYVNTHKLFFNCA